jgi:hypothetical protein
MCMFVHVMILEGFDGKGLEDVGFLLHHGYFVALDVCIEGFISSFVTCHDYS